MRYIALLVCLTGLTPILEADGLPVGTWVRRANPDGINATLVIEAAGTGRKLTFKIQVAGGGVSTMVATTQMDGKDVPVFVDGKASGQTMAIRILDDRHTINVIKVNGNPVCTQKSELSADGKVYQSESCPGAKSPIEYWDKK